MFWSYSPLHSMLSMLISSVTERNPDGWYSVELRQYVGSSTNVPNKGQHYSIFVGAKYYILFLFTILLDVAT